MYDVICHYDFRIIDAKKNNIFKNAGLEIVSDKRTETKVGAQRFLFYLCAPKLLFVYKRFWIEINRPLLVQEIVDKDLEA